MKNITEKKCAFSLFEAVVVMGIVAIFVASAMNVFTKKHNKVEEKSPHGRFECYYQSGNLVQEQFSEKLSLGKKSVSGTYCTFKPIRNAAYYVVNMVGGGGTGEGTYGGAAGVFRSFFVTSFEKELRMTPGKASSATSASSSSTISEVRNNGDIEQLAEVAGGSRGYNSSSFAADMVSSCSVTANAYACNVAPSCSAYDQYIYVAYCKKDEAKTENNPLAHGSEQLSYSEVSSGGSFNSSSRILTYKRPAPLTGGSVSPYTITLELSANTSGGSAGAESNFNAYLNASGINSGISDVHCGEGGSSGSLGRDGCIIIVW